MYHAFVCGSRMVRVNVHYPRCQSAQIYRHGYNSESSDFAVVTAAVCFPLTDFCEGSPQARL